MKNFWGIGRRNSTRITGEIPVGSPESIINKISEEIISWLKYRLWRHHYLVKIMALCVKIETKVFKKRPARYQPSSDKTKPAFTERIGLLGRYCWWRHLLLGCKSPFLGRWGSYRWFFFLAVEETFGLDLASTSAYDLGLFLNRTGGRLFLLNCNTSAGRHCGSFLSFSWRGRGSTAGYAFLLDLLFDDLFFDRFTCRLVPVDGIVLFRFCARINYGRVCGYSGCIETSLE